MSLENYQFRKSFYNLVELSLLARMYVEKCLPLQAPESADPLSLQQTLLMMKATETKGSLEVVICGADPVGFLWQYEGRLLSLFVLPEHKNQGVEEELRRRISH